MRLEQKKEDLKILLAIETKMLEKGISRSDLAVKVNRHKSTLSKFFNPQSASRSRHLMREILTQLKIKYHINGKSILLDKPDKSKERELFDAWVHSFNGNSGSISKKFYESLKKMIIAVEK